VASVSVQGHRIRPALWSQLSHPWTAAEPTGRGDAYPQVARPSPGAGRALRSRQRVPDFAAALGPQGITRADALRDTGALCKAYQIHTAASGYRATSISSSLTSIVPALSATERLPQPRW